MKAIIPVAGAGTRLRPHTYTQPKALIPIAGKPILSFIVDPLAEAGITEFVFVIGYLGDKIIDYIDQKYPRLHCHFIQQSQREGSGQAIALTKEFIGNDEVFIVMGDTICEFNVKEVLNLNSSALGLKKVDDPRHFGVAELNEGGFITHVVEKPQIPKSNMAIVGLYKIKETQILFQCLEENFRRKVKSHDEYQLTDALECMIEKNIKFSSFKVSNWFDCGRKDSLLETNSILLKKNDNVRLPEIPYENTIVIPPVSIASHCNIKNSIIGPNVTVGDNTVINYSIIKNTIIGAYSNLNEVVLNSSIIGSDANIHGFTQSLNIGDNTEIDLG